MVSTSVKSTSNPFPITLSFPSMPLSFSFQLILTFFLLETKVTRTFPFSQFSPKRQVEDGIPQMSLAIFLKKYTWKGVCTLKFFKPINPSGWVTWHWRRFTRDRNPGHITKLQMRPQGICLDLMDEINPMLMLELEYYHQHALHNVVANLKYDDFVVQEKYRRQSPKLKV